MIANEVPEMSAKPKTKRQRHCTSRTRTGCQACKKKHVRCDEVKPVCTRCQQTNTEDCVYDPIRVFDFKPQNSSRRNKSHVQPARGEIVLQLAGKVAANNKVKSGVPGHGLPLSIPQNPSPHPFTSEELHALRIWTTHTGPWLSHYGPLYAQSLWTTTLPRIAASLPALKHIMVAIALLDYHVPPYYELHDVADRYQRILRHYNHSIALLARSTEITTVELLFSAMLSWLLEVMGFNGRGAMMHLDAVRKICTVEQTDSSPPKTTSGYHEADGILDAHLPATMELCEGYATLLNPPLRSEASEGNSSSNPLLVALDLRHRQSSVSSCEDIVKAIKHYYEEMRPQVYSKEDIEQAWQYIYRWKVAIVRFRYSGTASPSVVLLCYLSMALAHSLLPGLHEGEAEDAARDRREKALAYVLARTEDINNIEGLDVYDALVRERVTGVVARVVLDTSMDQKRKYAALMLLERSALHGNVVDR